MRDVGLEIGETKKQEHQILVVIEGLHPDPPHPGVCSCLTVPRILNAELAVCRAATISPDWSQLRLERHVCWW